jgi:hypothetical protein
LRTTAGTDRLPNGTPDDLISQTTAPTLITQLPHNSVDLADSKLFALQLELWKTTSPSTWPTAFAASSTTKLQAWGASTLTALDRILLNNNQGGGFFGPYLVLNSSVGTPAAYREVNLGALGSFTVAPVPNVVNVANVGVTTVQFYPNSTLSRDGLAPFGFFAYLLSFTPAEATPAGETHVFSLRVVECYGRAA